MPGRGSVIARVYTSDAYLPIDNAAVTFTQVFPDGTRKLLALRRSNSSGLTEPVFLDTPEASQSQSPGSAIAPYATVDVQIEHPGYSGILAQGVQVFPGVETIQGFQLRPLPVTENGSASSTVPGSTQNL